MPACITHYLFAQKVLEALPNWENIDRCAYDWGAQGPDFLFCHRYFSLSKEKSLKEYGNALHQAPPSVTLEAMRTFLKQHKEPVYRSYVWGFLCHYALDSTAHPYVNALAAELAEQRPAENTSTMHGEIESALDAIVLRSETGKLPSDFPLKRTFPKNEGVQRRIAKLYRDVLFAVFGKNVSEEELLRATYDANFVFSCVTDRTGLKKRLFEVLEKGRPHYIASHIVPLVEREDIDYANVRNMPWKDNGEMERSVSFFELYSQAQNLAQKLIGGFMEGNLSELTQDKPFG